MLAEARTLGPGAHDLPKKRPNWIVACVYGMSGAYFSWSLETATFEQLRQQVVSEMVNVALISALFLNISVNPLMADPPEFLGEDYVVVSSFYCFWGAASMCFAMSSLIAVVYLINFGVLHEDAELHFFYVKIRFFIHAPLLLLIVGGLLMIMDVFLMMYFAIGRDASLAMYSFWSVVLISATLLFTYLVQITWDAKMEQLKVNAARKQHHLKPLTTGD